MRRASSPGTGWRLTSSAAGAPGSAFKVSNWLITIRWGR